MKESVRDEATEEISATANVMAPNSNRNAIVSLEEELAIQEATLRNLVRRQQEILPIDKATRQRNAHQERLAALQARRTTLEETRQKHVKLQSEIQDALEKSQERLVRVVAAAGLQAGDVNDDENGVDTIVNVENESSDGAFAVVDDEPVNQEQQQDGTTSQQDDLIAIPVPNLHLDQDVMTKFLQSRGDTGLAVFLPCLNSSDLIQQIMNVAALEILALDQKDAEGNHRQECLWKTCLDFLSVSGKVKPMTVSSSLESNDAVEGEASTPVQQDEPDAIAIDPNVALCPYELAGECADPYCPYQHMKPRNVESEQILARERLPLPTLKLPDTPSLSSSKEAVIVHDQSVSPPFSPLRKRRRLGGETQQHDEDDSVETKTQQDDEESVHTQVLSTQDDTDGQNKVFMDGENHDKEGDPQGGDANVESTTMEWNDDFVSLPPAANDPDQDSDDSSGSGSNEDEVDVAAVQLQEANVAHHEQDAELSIPEFWWHNDGDVARMKESPEKLSTLRLSMTDWLEVVGGFQVEPALDEDGTPALVLKCSELPSLSILAVATAGRLVDCVRVCIHAGRFDLAFALCDFAHSSLYDIDKMDDHGTVEEMLETFVDHLVKLRDAAFYFNSDPRTTLCCSFETEIFLATASEALKLVHKQLSSDLNAWPEALLKVLTFLGRANDRDMTLAGSLQTATPWKEMSKEWEEFGSTGSENKVQNSDDVDDYQHNLRRFDTLLKAIEEKGWSLMDSLAQCPMELLVDDVLKPVLAKVRAFADKLKDNDLDCSPLLCKTGYVLLGCGEAVCSQIVTGVGQGLDTSSTLTAIDSCIYQIVTCLTNIASSSRSLAELSLAPLYAFSVSLASTLRRYGKAQRRLEAALNVVLSSKGRNALCSGYLIYSELLWSQLIQLRSSLPLLSGTEGKKRFTSLPIAVKSEHRIIASTVNAFGVEPSHVTLCGDWNMFKAFDAENRKYAALAHVRKYCRVLFSSLFSNKPSGNNSLLCNLCYLPLTVVDMPMRSPSVSSLAFPQSTLLVGRELSVLVANKCELKQLPLAFGMYFPNLKVLKLADNGLTELPDSIGKLRSLADLDVSRNVLQSLPSTIGSLKKLTRLDVNHNKLSTLPVAITKCKSLEEVLLMDNPIRIADLPNDFTLKCPNLYKLVVDKDDIIIEEE